LQEVGQREPDKADSGCPENPDAEPREQQAEPLFDAGGGSRQGQKGGGTPRISQCLEIESKNEPEEKQMAPYNRSHPPSATAAPSRYAGCKNERSQKGEKRIAAMKDGLGKKKRPRINPAKLGTRA